MIVTRDKLETQLLSKHDVKKIVYLCRFCNAYIYAMLTISIWKTPRFSELSMCTYMSVGKLGTKNSSPFQLYEYVQFTHFDDGFYLHCSSYFQYFQKKHLSPEDLVNSFFSRSPQGVLMKKYTEPTLGEGGFLEDHRQKKFPVL